MNQQQLLQQLRQEFAMNERLGKMLQEYAKLYADAAYRKTGNVSDHATLLRLTSVASGVEEFILTLKIEAKA